MWKNKYSSNYVRFRNNYVFLCAISVTDYSIFLYPRLAQKYFLVSRNYRSQSINNLNNNAIECLIYL